MNRYRVATALDRDDRLQCRRRDIGGTGEQCGGDHRITQSGRAMPAMFAAGTAPKYRLSKLRGS